MVAYYSGFSGDSTAHSSEWMQPDDDTATIQSQEPGIDVRLLDTSVHEFGLISLLL